MVSRLPQVFCLPDSYEVVDRSLDNIRAVLTPQFAAEDVARLDSSVRWARTLEGVDYMPGLLGLNNMKANDYVNVAIQVSETLSRRGYWSHAL